MDLFEKYIFKNYAKEIKEHEESTAENNLCGCDFETQGLCRIGRWLNSCMSTIEFLQDENKISDFVTCKS